MANRRIITKRRKAVRNIRKITRTMQLIATARFQATYNRAVATKPYSEKLGEMVASLAGLAADIDHPLMTADVDAGRSSLLVITSNRGLCGGYNANVLRGAVKHIDGLAGEGVESDVCMVGKKGVNYFKFLDRPMVQRITDLSHIPGFEQIEPLAGIMMDRFKKGEVSSVHVAYMRFISTGQQKSAVIQLLPFADESPESTQDAGESAGTDFEFSPEPKELLDELLPAAVRVRLFQCFTEASVSEQIARMVAMKAATDAADDTIGPGKRRSRWNCWTSSEERTLWRIRKDRAGVVSK